MYKKFLQLTYKKVYAIYKKKVYATKRLRIFSFSSGGARSRMCVGGDPLCDIPSGGTPPANTHRQWQRSATRYTHQIVNAVHRVPRAVVVNTTGCTNTS